jgi:hypothetical protein
MWWLMLNLALAGKLSEGYKGIPFGPEIVLINPPSENCISAPSPGITWGCRQKIGEASALVTYVAEEGIFYGVYMSVASLSDAQVLMNVLKAAYGPGTKMNSYQLETLPDWMWQDNNVIAVFKFNQFTVTGTLAIYNKEWLAEVDARKAAKAALSIDDL